MSDPAARTILLATSNPGKAAELDGLLSGRGWRGLRPGQLGIRIEVAEDGDTFAENSARKALAFSELTELPVLADDSGLEVDALQGAPGVRTARLAEGSDADRTEALLAIMHGMPAPLRSAQFRSVVTIACRGSVLAVGEGTLRGSILTAPRGESGFGYDPVFVPAGGETTLAQLGLSDKNSISHRRAAVLAALEELERR
ncbi:MAG: non-canonical purine NTP pyrophosphatase [Chloroflexota bacterium]|nr:non-canonical purine NTP pyrophosphatase [Chloroflexota bacterium]